MPNLSPIYCYYLLCSWAGAMVAAGRAQRGGRGEAGAGHRRRGRHAGQTLDVRARAPARWSLSTACPFLCSLLAPLLVRFLVPLFLSCTPHLVSPHGRRYKLEIKRAADLPVFCDLAYVEYDFFGETFTTEGASSSSSMMCLLLVHVCVHVYVSCVLVWAFQPWSPHFMSLSHPCPHCSRAADDLLARLRLRKGAPPI